MLKRRDTDSFESVSLPDHSQGLTCTRPSLHVWCLELHLIQPPTKCGSLYSLRNCPVFTQPPLPCIQHQSTYDLQRVIVGPLAAVNWIEKYLMVTLTYWPEFSCLDHKAHRFIFPQRRTSDIWKWWPLLPPTQSPRSPHTYQSLLWAKCPSGSSYFQWVINQKCWVPFFDGKIPLIYHEGLFSDSQNERVGWPITNISFNGVFQRQSHSTSFKWHVGKEKEIAFMEYLLRFGHITVIKSWDLHNNPLKYILLYPIL